MKVHVIILCIISFIWEKFKYIEYNVNTIYFIELKSEQPLYFALKFSE